MEENKISIFQFKWMILIQYHALGPFVHVIYFSIGLTALKSETALDLFLQYMTCLKVRICTHFCFLSQFCTKFLTKLENFFKLS